MHILLTAMPESPGTFWEQFTGHFQTALENSGVFLAYALWALIKVAAIFLAARFTLAVVSRMTRHVMNSARYHRTESGGKRTDTVMTLTRSFSRYLIYSVALVMALVELGVGDLVNNLIVTAGIGSVAIGFGAQSLVKDMVTGFFLMFENQFSVDSIHEGTITEMTDKGAVVALGENVEGFCPARQLTKEDGTTPKVGDKLDFKVLEFSKATKRITLSHLRTYEEAKRAEVAAEKAEKRAAADATKSTVKKINASVEKTTLGDIAGLAALKSAMEAAEAKNAKKAAKEEKAEE